MSVTTPRLRLVSSPPADPVVARRRGDVALDDLRGFLDDARMQKKTGSRGFAEFERSLHAKLMEVERELVGEAIEQADIDAAVVLIDGTAHRRVLRSAETYMTAAGPVRVERTLYKDRTDTERAISPMERRMGIIEGFWTPLAAEQAVWVVAQMTPQKAEELFRRVGNMRPSKSTLDRLPKAISERWEDDRESFERVLRQDTLVPPEAISVAVSIDGVMAPFDGTEKAEKRAETASQGRLTRGPAGYREVGCATLSFCDAKGEMLSAIRIARVPESKKATLKKSLLAELAEVLAVRPDLRIVKVADGAEDNWTFLRDDVPSGVEVVDFFHASEHLGRALADVYGDGTLETRRRLEDLRMTLLEDRNGIDKVIRALVYLRGKSPRSRTVAQELAYFRKHRGRMRYRDVTDEGLPVGSGVVEAACKTLVTQRLKQSGMRWSAAGAQAILTPRAWDQSERFDRAWALVAATYESTITTVHNVVPLMPAGPLPKRPPGE